MHTADFRSKCNFSPKSSDNNMKKKLLYTAYWNSFVKHFESSKRLMKWYIYLLLKHSIDIDNQLVLQKTSERTTLSA